MSPDEILNTSEASSYLKIHIKTVRSMARDGQLPCFKLNSEWRFRRSELDRWIGVLSLKQEKQRALVVDDDEIIREYLPAVLEDVGYTVLTASNGKEALAVMKNVIPDVILLDLEMPVMDGPETLRHIKEDYPDIHIVIVTGFADSDLMKRALKWAPFSVVRKPFLPAEYVMQAMTGRLHVRFAARTAAAASTALDIVSMMMP